MRFIAAVTLTTIMLWMPVDGVAMQRHHEILV